MADKKMVDTSDEEVASQNDLIRVKDLTSPDTNPNIPRSVFDVRNQSEFDAGSVEHPFTVDNRFHSAGKGFKSKSVTVKYASFDHSFDAGGQSGNPGDVLVYVLGQWIVVPKSKFDGEK